MWLSTPTPQKQRSTKSRILLAPAIAGCIALATWAEATWAQPGASAASNATSYLPTISDFMIETIQPRHVRLWVAARNGDWPFAAYELGNLKGAFVRLGLAHPMDHEIPLRDLISSVTATPFEDLHKAIESKDTAAFAKAYVPTLRSWSETVFAGALDPSRPPAERAAILDEFYGAYEAEAAREPDRHRMDYVHCVMEISKAG